MASNVLPRTSTRLSTASGIVSEVLTIAGNLEKQDLNAKLGDVSKKIEEVKVDMTESLKQKYVDFCPNLKTGLDLCKRVDDLALHLNQVTSKVDSEVKSQLNISTVEFQALTSKLDESECILAFLDKLVKIHDNLTLSRDHLSKGNYEGAAKHLSEVETLLKKPVNSKEADVAIIVAINKTYNSRMKQLLQDLAEAWLKRVKWTVPESQSDIRGGKKISVKNEKVRTEIRIDKGESDTNISLASTVRAMNMVGMLEPKLKSLGEKLITYVIKPLLSTSEIQLQIQSQTLIIISQPDKKPCPLIPEKVLDKIHKVMKFLHDNMLNTLVPINRDLGNDTSNIAEESLMFILGKLIVDDFLEMIIKDCLASSIPSSSTELVSFSENTVEIVSNFEEHLKNMQFIDVKNTVLSSFVNDVDLLFANKKTQEILQKARNLMTSEIHDCVKVGFNETSDKAGSEYQIERESSTSAESPPSSRYFQLPMCCISTSAEKLMKLAYDTLDEACRQSNPQCAIQLFYTVRNMFELYCEVVPTFHKDSLLTLPQLSALYHNNSIYIAHHLMTIGHQFRASLPDPLRESSQVTFLDLVPRMRRIGAECFIKQINRQKIQLIESLSGAQGFVGISDEDSYDQAERAIGQTLHQFTHLKRVWIEILPHSVYCKSIGCLLNTVLVEVISAITTLEDISADDANMLNVLLGTLIDKLPELFLMSAKDKSSDAKALLSKRVAKWQKLLELKMVLDASLMGISDRWADGKGPLAEEFPANEIKQLIRALFQNTDRRAVTLSKIK